MAPCDTPLILDIFLWERPKYNNRTTFSIITSRMLIGRIATLVLDGKLYTAMTHSWTRSTQMHHTALGQLGKSELLRKKAERVRTKLMVDHKSVLESREKTLKYCQVPYIAVDRDFHYLCGKTVALVKGFHSIDGQCNIKWQLLSHKRVSRTETRNCIPHILLVVSTCPCPWSIILAKHA